MQLPELLWRVGHASDPLGLVPRLHCSWANRFDDPARRFRTLYVAELSRTGFRERLQDYRASLGSPATPLPAGLRHGHALAAGTVQPSALRVADLFDPSARLAILHRHAGLFRSYGLDRLDVVETTSRDRRMTQRLARALFDVGTDAIRYPSLIDGQPCWALFEGRFWLDPVGDALSLSTDLPDLVLVGREFGVAV